MSSYLVTIFFLVMRTFQICSLKNFQIYSVIQLESPCVLHHIPMIDLLYN